MKRSMRNVYWLAAATLLAAWFPLSGEAKSYSSGGGHSYSSSSHGSSSGSSHGFSSGSHSTHSSGFGSAGGGSSHGSSSSGSGSKSTGASTSHGSGPNSRASQGFTSGGGKSYSAGSTWSDEGRHSYTSSKSYTSSPDHKFTSGSSIGKSANAIESARQTEPDKNPARFAFDSTAARARKEEASQQEFTRFKESQLPPKTPSPAPASRSDAPTSRSAGSVLAVPSASTPSYQVKPPPIPVSAADAYRRSVYIPDTGTLSSRPNRIYNVFNSYSTRPVVVYHDRYNSLFWWWLLDRSFDDRAWWAYHHRYDMDPARYQALVANDQQLERRVEQLEAQQAPRDLHYVPAGLDQDLMYSDRYVEHTYSNRRTTSGVVAFWVLGIPMALGVSGMFIWLIWFKRWPTATC